MERASKRLRDEGPIENLLVVRTSAVDGHVRVAVDGAVDMATAPRLRDGLRDALRHRLGTIVVDLTTTTYFGSHGLAALLDARSDAAGSGTALVLVLGDNRLVGRILAITGADKVFTIRTQDASPSDDGAPSHQ